MSLAEFIIAYHHNQDQLSNIAVSLVCIMFLSCFEYLENTLKMVLRYAHLINDVQYYRFRQIATIK